MQAALDLLAGLAAGVSLEDGRRGALALIAFVLLVILAFGAIGLAGRREDGLGGAGSGPVLAHPGACSSCPRWLMPRNLITEDWFKTIATYNPLSYLIEAGAQPVHHRLGRPGAGAGLRDRGVALIVGLALSVTASEGEELAR